MAVIKSATFKEAEWREAERVKEALWRGGVLASNTDNAFIRYAVIHIIQEVRGLANAEKGKEG